MKNRTFAFDLGSCEMVGSGHAGFLFLGLQVEGRFWFPGLFAGKETRQRRTALVRDYA